MNQIINEGVSVTMDYNHYQNKIYPVQIQWKNRDYRVDKVSLHHQYYQGKNLLHVFSVVSSDIFFKLVLDTENLHWKIAEVADGES